MDWGDIFEGLFGVAAVAGAGYLAYQGTQWTFNKMDEFNPLHRQNNKKFFQKNF
jgi:hypothetical protein